MCITALSHCSGGKSTLTESSEQQLNGPLGETVLSAALFKEIKREIRTFTMSRQLGNSICCWRPCDHVNAWQPLFCSSNITPTSASYPRHDTYYRALRLHWRAPGMQVRKANAHSTPRHHTQDKQHEAHCETWTHGPEIYLYIFNIINNISNSWCFSHLKPLNVISTLRYQTCTCVSEKTSRKTEQICLTVWAGSGRQLQ